MTRTRHKVPALLDYAFVSTELTGIHPSVDLGLHHVPVAQLVSSSVVSVFDVPNRLDVSSDSVIKLVTDWTFFHVVCKLKINTLTNVYDRETLGLPHFNNSRTVIEDTVYRVLVFEELLVHLELYFSVRTLVSRPTHDNRCR